MDNTSLFDILLDAINTLIGYMSEMQFMGISALAVCVFGFILMCIWRFIISPLFGVSAGVSDVVQRSVNNVSNKIDRGKNG